MTGVWVQVARTATGLNVLLLAALAAVWARNFYAFRTRHTLGLLVFGVFLLVENALGFYYYLIDPTLSVWFSTEMPVIAWRATMLLHVLEFVGVAVLAWTTWDPG